MILIVVTIMVLMSILLSAFIAFSPSFTALIESDIRRRVNENAYTVAFQLGELRERSDLLPDCNSGANDVFYLRARSEVSGVNEFFRIELCRDPSTGDIVLVSIESVNALPAGVTPIDA